MFIFTCTCTSSTTISIPNSSPSSSGRFSPPRMSNSEETSSRPQRSRNDVFNTDNSYFPPLSGPNAPSPSRAIPNLTRDPSTSSPPTIPPSQSSPLSPLQPRESPLAPRPQRARGANAVKGKLTTAMIQDKLCELASELFVPLFVGLLAQMTASGWICFTSESDPDSTSKGRWIHPCKCALFCHETCLLAWIAEYQARNKRGTNSTVSCPQCNTPYTIKQSSSWFLEKLEGASRTWDRMAVRISVVGVGTGITAISYFYGVSATRAFLGPQAFNQLIFRPFDVVQPKHMLTLPLVAPALILTRTNLIDGLFPLLPLALLNLPPPSFYTGDYTRMLRNVHVPGPATTCVLLPFFRLFYLKARSWVYKTVLTRRSNKSGASHRTGEQTPRPATPAPNTPAVQLEGQLPAQPLPPAEPAHEADLEQGAHVTLSLQRLAGMVVGALLLPYLSAGAGELLLQASQSSQLLRTILGVQSPLVWKSAMMNYVPLSADISLDPAWWRNFLGGCICVITNDTFKVGPFANLTCSRC